MTEDPGVFRTQLVGGFNRQDVIRYIRQLAGERNRLQAQLDALAQEPELEPDLPGAAADKPEEETPPDASAAEIAGLREELDRAAEENERLRRENRLSGESAEQAQTRAAALEAELRRLRGEFRGAAEHAAALQRSLAARSAEAEQGLRELQTRLAGLCADGNAPEEEGETPEDGTGNRLPD